MQKSTFREYAESILIAAILALFIRTFVFQAFNIPSGSMEHNLVVGDHILVNKFIYAPTATSLERWLLPMRSLDRQDIIVFRGPPEPEKDFIKRVLGLPGESVEVRDGVVYVDGDEIDEPYVNHDSAYGQFHDSDGLEKVPQDEYYVLGDNRENSRDSRYWGTVPRSSVKGKAMLVYWSYEVETQVLYPAGLADRLAKFTDLLLHFFTRTRWDRTFKVINSH